MARADDFDRPITAEGVALLAARHGYRFSGFLEPLAGFEDRFAAVFLPEPDDGRTAILADGRTQARALRRGLEGCRLAARGELG